MTSRIIPCPAPPRPWAEMPAEERLDWFRAARAAGVSTKEIARVGHTSIKTLDTYLRGRGFTMADFPLGQPDDAPWLKRSVPVRMRALQELSARGVRGNVALAKALGCGVTAIRKFIAAHKVDIPPYDPAQRPRRSAGNAPARPKRSAIPKAVQVVAPKPKPAEVIPMALRTFPDRVHMLDSRRGQCKFPLWPHGSRPRVDQMFYCGSPVDPSVEVTSYCPDCRAVIRRTGHTAEEKEAYALKMAWIRRAKNRALAG